MGTGESCVHETVSDEARNCKIIFVRGSMMWKLW